VEKENFMPGIKDKVVVITGASSESIDAFASRSFTLAPRVL
jgi:NADP-dependent 3-hydroxy acid dehydrogenase YdfG